MSDDYWEEDCPHCGKSTLHKFHDAGHERDSSQNYRECTVCKWYKYDHADEYSPPFEVWK